MNKLLSAGCSIETLNPNWTPVTSQLIANQFNLKYENVAHGGVGNFYIFQKVIDKVLSDQSIKFVTIGWSHFSRFDLFDHFATPIVSKFELRNCIDKINLEENQFTDCINSSMIIRSLTYILMLQNLLSSKQIEYVMWWNMAPQLDLRQNQKVKELLYYINKKTFYKIEQSLTTFNSNVSLFTLAQDKNLLLDPPRDSHPNSTSHKIWSENILNFISKHSLYTVS